jgi:hypothetical protein
MLAARRARPLLRGRPLMWHAGDRGGTNAHEDRRHHPPDDNGRVVPASALVRLPAARPGCPGGVQARRSCRGLRGRDAGRAPRPGGRRARHRDGRPDELRRLRRRHRLVLLVHVRADPGVRGREGGAPGGRGAGAGDDRAQAPLRLGRRHQQRAGGARAHPPRRPLQDREPPHDEADQGLCRGRPRQPRLARLLRALQGPEGAELRARRSSKPR